MSKTSDNRIWLAAAAGVVLIAVLIGLAVGGSPVTARARRLDAARVTALTELTQAVDMHWTTHARLPGALEDLSSEGRPFLRLRDPESGQPYEYRALTDSTYELCAGFAQESRSGAEDLWAHGAGRSCFALRARQIPQLAPPLAPPRP